MADRTVWHPQKSIAADESEDGGRGSLLFNWEPPDPQKKGTKRAKTVIPRRRTPTVDVSALVANCKSTRLTASGQGKTKSRDTYETIERSGDGVPSILECSSSVYRRGNPEVSTSFGQDLSGWRDRELEITCRGSVDRSSTFSSFDRSRLQTPAENLRSQNKARTSAHVSSRGKRRECYAFQHFDEARHFIEHYRIFHSYTSFTVPGLKKRLCMGDEVSDIFRLDGPPEATKVVEQDSENRIQPGVKSYCREADDPYSELRELVSRLGVKGLVQRGLKPTPPSINKKTKVHEDLVVNGKTNNDGEIGLSDEQGSTGNKMHQSSPKSTRTVTRGSGGQNVSLELPQIAPTNQIPPNPRKSGQPTSNSVISVNKYLQISSQHQQPIVNEEEGSENVEMEAQDNIINLSATSQSCLCQTQNAASASSTSDDNPPQVGHDNNRQSELVEFNTPNSATMRTVVQEQLMMLDKSQKEKLLCNKAHALGLTSRDWARSTKARRMLGSSMAHGRSKEDSSIREQRQVAKLEEEDGNFRVNPKSRPQTRMVLDERRANVRSRMDRRTAFAVRQESELEKQSGGIERRHDKRRGKEGEGEVKRDHEDSARQRSPSKRSNRLGEEKDKRKLEQLKDIYDSSRHNRTLPSRCPTRQASRCGHRRASSRATNTRPTTSSQEYSTKRTRSISQSRPVTQTGRYRGRAFVREPSQMEQPLALDESCCWNEIPQRTSSHSNSNGQVQGSNSLDFDLDNIVLRAKQKSQNGVAMVTVRLGRNRKPSQRASSDTITPGAAPQEVTKHFTRTNRKLSDFLTIQNAQHT